MKKIVCLVASVLFLSGASAFAQGEMDAYKYSLEILMEPPVTWVWAVHSVVRVGMPLP